MRNGDRSPRFVNEKRLFQDATKYVAPVLSSPIFSKTSYCSSDDPMQFADAVSRPGFCAAAEHLSVFPQRLANLPVAECVL
jgi:hypothetical protein